MQALAALADAGPIAGLLQGTSVWVLADAAALRLFERACLGLAEMGGATGLELQAAGLQCYCAAPAAAAAAPVPAPLCNNPGGSSRAAQGSPASPPANGGSGAHTATEKASGSHSNESIAALVAHAPANAGMGSTAAGQPCGSHGEQRIAAVSGTAAGGAGADSTAAAQPAGAEPGPLEISDAMRSLKVGRSFEPPASDAPARYSYATGAATPPVHSAADDALPADSGAQPTAADPIDVDAFGTLPLFDSGAAGIPRSLPASAARHSLAAGGSAAPAHAASMPAAAERSDGMAAPELRPASAAGRPLAADGGSAPACAAALRATGEGSYLNPNPNMATSGGGPQGSGGSAEPPRPGGSGSGLGSECVDGPRAGVQPGALRLSLEEAFFLAHALGLLRVLTDRAGGGGLAELTCNVLPACLTVLY